MFVYPNDLTVYPEIFNVNITQLTKASNFPIFVGHNLRCSLCKGFLSPYCIIQEHPPLWKCALCGNTNKIPSPPSDSMHSMFSIIKDSPPYSSVFYDYIAPPNHEKIEPLYPLQILAIQSFLIPFLQPILSKLTLESTSCHYGLVIFDLHISIYNYHTKRLEVYTSDPTSETILFPSQKDTSRYFANSSTFLEELNHLPPPPNGSSYQSSRSEICNLSALFQFIQNLLSSLPSLPSADFHFSKEIEIGAHPDNFEFLHPFKVNALISGPIISISNQFNYQFPISIIHFGSYFSDFYQMIDIHKNLQNSIVQIDYELNPLYILQEISKLLNHQFVRAVVLKLRTMRSLIPCTVDQSLIEQSSRPQFNQKAILNEKFFEIARSKYGSAQLLSFVQFEVSFINLNNQIIRRFINIKIPLAPDPRITLKQSFPNTFEHLFTASSYLMQKLRCASLKSSIYQLRLLITHFSYLCSLSSNLFWPFYIHNLLNSPILNSASPIFQNDISSLDDGLEEHIHWNKSFELMNKHFPSNESKPVFAVELFGKFDSYRDCHPAISFLEFLPLDLVDTEVVPPYNIGIPLTFERPKIIARITYDSIFELNGFDDAAETLKKKCQLENLDLPIIKVNEIPYLRPPEIDISISKWKDNWIYSQYGFHEELLDKVYHRKKNQHK